MRKIPKADRRFRFRRGRRPLARAVTLTRAGLVAERGLRAFWPFLSLLALCFAALSFRLPDLLPARAAAALLWLMAGALAGAFGFGLWHFRWPGREEAIARLDATLPDRPLTALRDRMALGQGDDAARALWRAHLARMAGEARAAHPVPPRPDLSRRDPYAIRLSALTAAVLALLFGAPGALFSPVAPAGPAGPGAAQAGRSPGWEGWAAPPRYTGKPGIYLNDFQGDTLTVPAGTAFSFRFYGDPGRLRFEESVSNPASAGEKVPSDKIALSGPAADAPQERDFEAVRSGAIAIGGMGGRAFRIAVLPDRMPEVSLGPVAERRADGRFVQPFSASDDYGIVSGTAQIALDLPKVRRIYGLRIAPEPRPDLVYDLPLPISGSRKAFEARMIEDAAKSPWANLPVRLRLRVTDGRGQTGESTVRHMVLPGRRFFDPRAAALIEMRRDLLWNRANAPEVASILRAISNRPGELSSRPETGAAIRAVALRIEAPDFDAAARDKVAGVLWDLAALLEDGGLTDALDAMSRAEQRLSEAIRNGASKDEIDKLMRDLQQATSDYLKMLAARDADQGPQFGRPQPTEQVTGNQIRQMMEEIRKLMEAGRMSEAQALLDQLAGMMRNMKVTRGAGGGDTGDSSGLGGMQRTLRDQQQLSDDAFRDLQKAPGAGVPGAGDDGNDPSGLADRQHALRRDLERRRALMPPTEGTTDGAEARRRLDDADRAMGEAEEALRDGDGGTAIDRQAEAIQALRDGMQAIGRAQSGAAGGENRGSSAATGEAGSGGTARDPLGRRPGEGAPIGTDREMLGEGGDVYGRARDLLDEIRRRSAERQRPEAELDYLGRLLDRF